MTHYRPRDALTSALLGKTFGPPSRKRRPASQIHPPTLVEPDPLLTPEETAALFWKGRVRERQSLTAAICGDPEPRRPALNGGLPTAEDDLDDGRKWRKPGLRRFTWDRQG